MQTFIRIHPGDSVAVALQPLAAGTVILAEGNPLTLQEDIPQGHKFALIPIRAGEPVIKYGAPIGTAFGITVGAPAAIGVLLADTAVKAATVDIPRI